MRNFDRLGFLALLATACTPADDGRRIEVAGDNAFGIVALEADHFERGGEPYYIVRALDRDRDEVASIQRRRGAVGTAGYGLELSVTLHGETTRIISYDLKSAKLNPTDPQLRSLLQLRELGAELAREQIYVGQPVTPASAETGYSDWTCGANELLAPTATVPIARQCCHRESWYSYWGDVVYYQPENLFIPDRGPQVGNVITRQLGTPCTRSDGSTCTSGTSPAQGGDCYYGPNGFAVASVQVPPAGQTWRIVATLHGAGNDAEGNPLWDYSCDPISYNGGYTPYADVVGTASPATCPGGGSTPYGWQGEY